MLRLEHIIKNYEMKGAEVKALKDVSICFRKNEFVPPAVEKQHSSIF